MHEYTRRWQGKTAACSDSPEEVGPARHEPAPIRTGYRCDATARTPQDGRSFPLGSSPATTPRLALRWLRRRARDIADQLDPPAARPARYWIRDDVEHERALSVLTHGETYTFTIFDDSTRYTLSARPTGTAR